MKWVANILNCHNMMEWQQKNVEEMTCSPRRDVCGLSSSSGSSVFSGDSLGSSAAVTGTGSSFCVIASTSTLLSSVFSSSFFSSLSFQELVSVGEISFWEHSCSPFLPLGLSSVVVEIVSSVMVGSSSFCLSKASIILFCLRSSLLAILSKRAWSSSSAGAELVIKEDVSVLKRTTLSVVEYLCLEKIWHFVSGFG